MTVQTPLAPARILVLVSGAGSNMRDLVAAAADSAWGGEIVSVLADRDCEAISWAAERGIATGVLKVKDFETRADWDAALADGISSARPDLIVSAGFLKLLGPAVLGAFEGRILNTHNSLLPVFPGVHGPDEALAAGAKVSGATLFFVDAGTDTGRIIAQTAVPVLDEDDAETLLERIKVAERAQLVESVGRLVREGWTFLGRRVLFGVHPDAGPALVDEEARA